MTQPIRGVGVIANYSPNTISFQNSLPTLTVDTTSVTFKGQAMGASISSQK
jgi:hypothetical protein